jgi:uncharacterized protein YdeI (BOF family)
MKARLIFFALLLIAAHGFSQMTTWLQEPTSDDPQYRLNIGFGTPASPARNVTVLTLTIEVDTTQLHIDGLDIDTEGSWFFADGTGTITIVEDARPYRLKLRLEHPEPVSGDGLLLKVGPIIVLEIDDLRQAGPTAAIKVVASADQPTAPCKIQQHLGGVILLPICGAETRNLEIKNLQGQTLLHLPVLQQPTTLQLPTGVYILSGNYSGRRVTTKISIW